MQIIVDAGGTSCTWVLIYNNGETQTISTEAIHALLTPDSEVIRIASDAHTRLNKPAPLRIYFYGAGCISPEVNNRIASLIGKPFNTEISVNTDLLCAARALFKNNAGIACILGTGSNSCLYNGTEITDNVSPLGFILGDEGSGAYLGRILLGDILKHQLPEHICQLFREKYATTRNEIIENVYRKKSPNRYLASFTPFLKENINYPEIESIVNNAFVSFLKRNVLNYRNALELPISFIGSIAWHFGPQLEKALRLCNMHLGTIEQNPVAGITDYHLNLPSVSL